jgi:hypothetical protein
MAPDVFLTPLTAGLVPEKTGQERFGLAGARRLPGLPNIPDTYPDSGGRIRHWLSGTIGWIGAQ